MIASRQLIVIRVMLVAAVLIAFGRIVAFGPVNWDDHETIFANPAMRSADAFVDAWTQPHLSLWIPVTHTLWAAIATVAQGQHGAIGAWPFRVVSLTLHALSTLMVFEIVRRIGTWKASAAAVAAAVFALHPMQVESVAWISGQKDLLAGALTFAAILAALRASNAVSRRAIVLAIAAMLAKPQAVVVLLVLPMTLRLAGASPRTALRYAAILVAPAVIVAVVARLAQPAPSVIPPALWQRPIVAMDALAFYARQLCWPAALAVDYGRTPASVIDGTHAATAIVFTSTIAAAAFVFRRRSGAIAGGLAIAAIALLPVLGLVPFEFQIYSTVSDHYVYTAMLGVAIAIAGAVDRLPGRIVWRLGTTIAVVLGARSFVQVGVWRDTPTLFERALSITPTSLAANRVLATEAAEQGDDGGAIDYLQAALRFHPGDPTATFNLANAFARVGRLEDARETFGKLVAIRPRQAAYRHNFAIVLIRLGDLDAAAAQLRAAIAIDPHATASVAALAKLDSIRQSASTKP